MSPEHQPYLKCEAGTTGWRSPLLPIRGSDLGPALLVLRAATDVSVRAFGHLEGRTTGMRLERLSAEPLTRPGHTRRRYQRRPLPFLTTIAPVRTRKNVQQERNYPHPQPGYKFLSHGLCTFCERSGAIRSNFMPERLDSWSGRPKFIGP